MHEMYLKQPGYTYRACDPFNKNKERMQKFLETGHTNYIIRTILIKLVFNIIWPLVNIRI